MTDDEWKRIQYFSKEEFDCTHTGLNDMQVAFMEKLDELRRVCGFAFVITSGFRDASHPAEVSKATKGGAHTLGIAADIRVSNGKERRIVVEEALKLGFNGVGVAKGFVHVDSRDSLPVMWTY